MNKKQYVKSRLEGDILYWFVGHTLAGSFPEDLFDAFRQPDEYEKNKKRVSEALEWEWERRKLSEKFKKKSSLEVAEQLIHAQTELHNIRTNMIHDAMEYIVKEGWCMNLKGLKKEMSQAFHYDWPPTPW